MYHVTPRPNVTPIMVRGLDPLKARSDVKRVYVCDRDTLIWTIKHVAENHDIMVHNLSVLKVDIPTILLRASVTSGVWYTRELIPPHYLSVWCQYADQYESSNPILRKPL